MAQKPVIGILLGDAAGVGPEIVARLLVEHEIQQDCYPLLIGDEAVLNYGFSVIGSRAAYQNIKDVDQTSWEGAVPLLDLDYVDFTKVEVGSVSAISGAGCLKMMETAVSLAKEGKIQGFSYAPFNKTALKRGGNPKDSELRYIADLLGHQGPFGEMNMVDGVWTTRVTSHIPICEVSVSLTVPAVLESIQLIYATLLKAGIASPRIGVCALNPHAGENGLCGTEEIDIILPAVLEAKSQGIDANGPFSADVLFVKAFEEIYDGIVTMYHDQGQIALKLRGFERGITIGGGLQVPVTTCAHGTAFDIAGKNLAGCGSLKMAIKMVSRMAANR